MNYDSFKARFSSLIMDGMSVTQILSCLDLIAVNYEITQKEAAPDAVKEGLPEQLSLYLSAKTVEGKSRKTIRLYRYVLSAFFSSVGKPVASIDTDDIRVYLARCRESGNKASTIGNIRRIISSFFEWCVLERIVNINPVKRIAPIKVEKSNRKAMKRIELEYLRNACETPREKAIIDFLYSTGARVSEVCDAKITDIDWDKRAVTIQHGKGDVTRTTYLNPEAEVSLRAYLVARTDSSPYIFARARGSSEKQLDAKSIQDMVKTIVHRTNRHFSVHITPHVFRHTIATVLLRNGMPVEQVQRYLGHAKIDTTMIYAEVSDEDVRRSHSLHAA